MDKKIFKNNRKKFFQLIKGDFIAILFMGQAPYKRGDEQYVFSPDRNFYYLTGIEREKCILFLGRTQETITETLYIERDNGPMAKWVGATMKEEEAREISGIETIGYLDEFEEALSTYIFRNNAETIYLDLEYRDWSAALSTSLQFAKEVRDKYPAIHILNSYPLFSSLRERKDTWEIERIQKAIDITCMGIKEMMAHARAGMMEYEIEAYFDFVLKKNGVRQKAFETIAASGKNGTILHYAKNNSKTKDGDLILVDVGAQVDWYNGDITRTFPVNGKFTERQKQVYNIVLEGQKQVIDAIAPDVPFADLNEILKEHYFVALKKIGLVTTKEEVARYYYHGVSHYLGAETHDIGRYMTNTLKPGMVLTVEPGLYIEEWEIGIRIEDDVLVTEGGHQVLSENMIKTVEEIEAFMAKGRSYGTKVYRSNDV
jgi:Xaa-Pro aminopeptidase